MVTSALDGPFCGRYTVTNKLQSQTPRTRRVARPFVVYVYEPAVKCYHTQSFQSTQGSLWLTAFALLSRPAR